MGAWLWRRSLQAWLFRHPSVVLGGWDGCEIEGSGQERGHLVSLYGVFGTVPVIGGRVASLGDTGGSQPVDVGFVDAAFVVGEQVIFRAGD